jgi:hypothetical protein
MHIYKNSIYDGVDSLHDYDTVDAVNPIFMIL